MMPKQSILTDRSIPKTNSLKKRTDRTRSRLPEALELLEERTMLTLFTVNTLSDTFSPPGTTSLRDAVTGANGTPGSVVRFDESLFDSAGQKKITLIQGNLPLTSNMTLYGPGAEHLQVSGNNVTQSGAGVFDVDFGIVVTMFGLEIAEGSSDFLGGGIYNGGNLTLDHMVFEGNSTQNAFGSGGAIYNAGKLTVSNTTFSGNMSENGAAIYNEGVSSDPRAVFVVMENSTLVQNDATGDGGGIYSQFGTVTVANSTFSGNSSDGQGGGIWADSATVNLTNVTMTLNRADSDGDNSGSGGGVAAVSDNQFTLNNTLVAGNLRGIGGSEIPDDLLLPSNQLLSPQSHNNFVGDPATAGGVVQGFNRNIVGDEFGGIRDLDRVLNPQLQDLGGSTLVHALALDSPARDHGNNSATFDILPSGVTRFFQSDQRGFHYGRVVDGTDSGREIADIGAVEMQSAPVVSSEEIFVVSSIDELIDGIFTPGMLTLREAFQLSNQYPDSNIITFAPEIRDEIQLFNGELIAEWDMQIVGPGASPYLSTFDQQNITQEEIDNYAATTLVLNGSSNGGRILRVEHGTRVDVSGLTFSDASDTDFGGALKNFGELEITDSVFRNNTSVEGGATTGTFGGAAIHNEAEGNLTLTDSVLGNNSVDTGSFWGGGAIFNSGTMVIERTTVTDNVTESAGGGILNNGDLTLGDGAKIYDNRAVNGAGLYTFNGPFGGRTNMNGAKFIWNEATGNGGAIYNDADMQLTRTLIGNNFGFGVNSKGAGIYSSGNGSVLITNSQIQRNLIHEDAGTLDVSGGGIYATPSGGGTFRLERSTLIGNEAPKGGGLVSDPGSQGLVVVNNSTITINSGRIEGPGILVEESAGITDIQNSTIAFNNNSSSPGGISLTQITNRGRIRNLSNNIIHGQIQPSHPNDSALEMFGLGKVEVRGDHNAIHPYSPTEANNQDFAFPTLNNLLNIDPLLPLPFLPPGSFTAVIAPAPDSPVIDKGFSGSGSNRRILDQVGQPALDVPSISNSTGGNGDDMGAYEVQIISKTQGWNSETASFDNQGNQTGTAVSQFGGIGFLGIDGDDQVTYGLGFDDGRRGSNTPRSGIDHEPGFLGFEFDTGAKSIGGISGGGCLDIGFTEICTPKFGAEVTFQVSAKIGLEYGYYVNAGSVEVFYEGEFINNINEFDDGNGGLSEAKIATGASILDGALYTVSPRFGAYVDLVVEIFVSVGGQACLFGCIGGNILKIDESYREQLFGVNRQLREGDESTADKQKGIPVFRDNDNTDYTGKKLDNDAKEPLFLKQDGSYTTNPVNSDGSFNPPAFSGEVQFLENPLGELLQAGAEKAFDKLKDQFDAVAKAENAKKKNQAKLSKASDADEQESIRKDIARNDTEIAKAKKDKKDQEKKKADAQCLGASKGLTCEFGAAEESLIGAKVTIGAGAQVKGVGVSKRIGDLTITIPDVQLSDSELDNVAGKLSATTDAFVKDSEQDEKRQVAKLSIDVAGLAGPLVGIPAGKYTIDALGVDVEAQLLSYNIETTLGVTQDIEASPFFNDPTGVTNSPGSHVAAYQFTNPVNVSVAGGPFVHYDLTTTADHDANPATPEVPSTARVEFLPGSRLRVRPDGGLATVVVPSLKVGSQFYNNVGLDIGVKGIFEALSLEISALDLSFGPVFRDEHGLGNFDLGSIFSTRFDLSTAPARGLEPFTIGGNDTVAEQDGTSPAGALELDSTVQPLPNDGSTVWYSVALTSPSGDAAYDEIDFIGNGSFQSVLVAESGLTLESLDNNGNVTGSQALIPGMVATLPFGNFRITGILDSTAATKLLIAVTSQSSTSIRAEPDEFSADRLIQEKAPEINLAVVDQANATYVVNDQALDIDGDGVISPYTDGILLTRYMDPNNLRGDALIRDAVNPEGTRTTAAEIEAYIATLPGADGSIVGLDRLDINGGGAHASEDGEQLLRHLSGLTDINLDPATVEVLNGSSKDQEFQLQFEASGIRSLRNGVSLDFDGEDNVNAQSVIGSSAWIPIDATAGGGVFDVRLDTYGQTIQYGDTYVTDEFDPTKRTLAATGAAGSPPRKRSESKALFEPVNASDPAEIEAFSNRIQVETRSVKLGAEESIFVKVRDAAGYEFTAPSGFQFTTIDFDAAAGENGFYNHSNSEDRTEIDFDVYLPDTGQWSSITVNANDQPILLAGGAGVSRFQLFPRQLADTARRGLEDTELPDMDLTVGFVLTGPATTPTIRIEELLERKPIVEPNPFGSDTQNFEIYSADYQLVRDGAVLKPVFTEVFRDPNNTEQPDPNRSPRVTTPMITSSDPNVIGEIPLSSLKYVTYEGGTFVDDTLIVDGSSNGPIDLPIIYRGNSSYDDDVDLVSGKIKHDPLEVDALRVVGGDVTINLINQYRLQGISLIDMRGSGSNTLVVDSTAVHDNSGASSEFYVLVDDSGPGADIVDKSASDWELQPTQAVEIFRGTEYTFDVYKTTNEAYLYISQGAPSVPGFASSFSAPPIAESSLIGPRLLITSQSAVAAAISQPTQFVTALAQTPQTNLGETVDVDLLYNYSGSAPPNGLSIQVHYDSDKLSFDSNSGLTLQTNSGYLGSTNPTPAAENVPDGDGGTDTIIELVWSDNAGWLSGATNPTQIATLSFTANGETGPSDITVTRTVNPLFEFEATGDIVTVTPPVFIVDNIIDENDSNTSPGDLSLREAIGLSSGGPAIIQFAPLLVSNGQPIQLTGGPLLLTDELTIEGPGADLLVIDGSGTNRIFDVPAGRSATLSGLTLRNGSASSGGAIQNAGTLHISELAITQNNSSGSGAGISNTNTGTMTIANSEISSNTSNDGVGGGIFSTGTLTVVNSTLSANQANAGGGLGVSGGTATLRNNTVTGNLADAGGFSTNSGGGVFIATLANAEIYNSIVVGNTSGAPGGANPNVDGSFSGSSANLIGNPVASVLDPTLRNNGGSTRTHSLVANSLAIDSGANSEANDDQGLFLTEDQRGQSRFFGSAVDIGAVESSPEPGFDVTESAGSTLISGAGASDSIDVVLTAPPATTVVVKVVSGNTGQVVVGTPELTFSSSNWDTPQTVPLNGIVNGIGSVTVTISVEDALSDDSFDHLPDQTITVNPTSSTSDLEILSLTDSPDPVSTGGTITYAANIINNGSSAATNVVITDTLPSGLTFSSNGSSTGCSAAGQVVTCSVGSLANGATANISIAAAVSNLAVGTINNTATVSGSLTDPVPGNNSATTSTVVQQSSGFDIDLTAFEHGALPNLVVEYDVTGGTASPFLVKFYSSTDGRFDASDSLIGSSLTVNNPTDLTTGSHSLSINQTALDSFLADPNVSFVVAVVDPDGLVPEGNEGNNDLNFVGVSHRSGGTLTIRGNDSSSRSTASFKDTVRLKSPGATIDVTFNGEVVNVAGAVPRILVLGNDGKDDVRSGTSISIPMDMRGGLGNDVLVGGEGDDTLDGGAGGDQLNGRAGNDRLLGDGTSGTAGSRDIIYGSNGDDTIIGGSATPTGKGDRLVGMAGRDSIVGSSGNDALLGRDDEDTMFGGTGLDALVGGRNDDSMDGGADNDKLFGSSGSDTLLGGTGVDLLRGGGGNDRLNGGLQFATDNAIDRIFGEGGFDTLTGIIDSLDIIKKSQIEDDQRSL